MRKKQGVLSRWPLNSAQGAGLGELEGGPKALVTLNPLSGGQSLLEGRDGGEPWRRGLPCAWGVGGASPSPHFPLQCRREPEWILFFIKYIIC